MNGEGVNSEKFLKWGGGGHKKLFVGGGGQGWWQKMTVHNPEGCIRIPLSQFLEMRSLCTFSQFH